MSTRREREQRERRFVSAKEVAEKQKGFELACIKLPPGVKRFSFREEKVYRVNVTCYEVKKPKREGGNPNCDPGCCTYERTFYVHPNLGPNNESHCCLAKNWGEPCPVCDAGEKPKKRQLILLKEKGDNDFQVYEGPHFNGLGGLIDEKIDATEEEDHPYRRHYYPKGGQTLAVKVTKTGFSTADGRSGTFMKPTNIEMEPRKDFDESIIDEAPDLDEMPVKLSYKELQRIFQGSVEDKKTPPPDDDMPKAAKNGKHTEEDEPTPPSRKELRGEEGRTDARGSTPNPEQYEKGEFVLFDGIQWEIKRVNRDGTLDLEDDDEQVERGIDPDEVRRIRVKGKETKESVPVPVAKTPKEDKEEEPEEDGPPSRRGARPRRN